MKMKYPLSPKKKSQMKKKRNDGMKKIKSPLKRKSPKSRKYRRRHDGRKSPRKPLGELHINTLHNRNIRKRSPSPVRPSKKYKPKSPKSPRSPSPQRRQLRLRDGKSRRRRSKSPLKLRK